MGKSIADLTTEELDGLAADAWNSAAREALAQGLSVTGSRDGRRYRYHPDGRIEDLGPVARLPGADGSQDSEGTFVDLSSSISVGSGDNPSPQEENQNDFLRNLKGLLPHLTQHVKKRYDRLNEQEEKQKKKK